MPPIPDPPKDTLTIIRVASYTIGTIVEPFVPITCEIFALETPGWRHETHQTHHMHDKYLTRLIFHWVSLQKSVQNCQVGLVSLVSLCHSGLNRARIFTAGSGMFTGRASGRPLPPRGPGWPMRYSSLSEFPYLV
jgi:hypothetical protein